MKLLIFGRTGQIAQELRRLVPSATFLSRSDVDLADPSACARAILSSDAEAAINAAAWTAVDNAEADEAAATVINSDAPRAMACAAAAKRIPFIHISTDYVFDGTGTRPWKTDDRVDPLGAYGRSKLKGEIGVRSAGGTYVILRTSWVFSAHGNNFVKTMLRLGSERDRLNVVADQIGGPTAAADIAAACIAIIDTLSMDASKTGTYHFAGMPDVSWADFARAIFTGAGLSTEVVDIPTSSYPTPARRPSNSRLDCESLSAFGLPRPDWRLSLENVLAELAIVDCH